MQTGTGQTGMQTFNQGPGQCVLCEDHTLDMAISRSSNADELQDRSTVEFLLLEPGQNPVASKR